MQYIGIQTQQNRNNIRSVFLLFLFPCLVGVLSYLFCYLLVMLTQEQYVDYSRMDMVNDIFLQSIPYIIGGVDDLVPYCLFCQHKHYQSCYRSKDTGTQREQAHL